MTTFYFRRLGAVGGYTSVAVIGGSDPNAEHGVLSFSNADWQSFECLLIMQAGGVLSVEPGAEIIEVEVGR